MLCVCINIQFIDCVFCPEQSAPENLDMTMAKYNARFALGFSESIATVTFDSLQTVIVRGIDLLS
jgi:hypothetical protein